LPGVAGASGVAVAGASGAGIAGAGAAGASGSGVAGAVVAGASEGGVAGAPLHCAIAVVDIEAAIILKPINPNVFIPTLLSTFELLTRTVLYPNCLENT